MINQIKEDIKETEFAQRFAIINFGCAPISTYNLVNCIAVGGTFILADGKKGSFLTHESPTEYFEQYNKLHEIKRILDEKSAVIISIIIFHCDKPSKDIYTDGLTTEIIVNMIKRFSDNLFNINPIMKTYSCDHTNARFGKAIISPDSYETKLADVKIFYAMDTNVTNPSTEKFMVEVLHNINGDKVYKCPVCNIITGTYVPLHPEDISAFGHKYNCANKNKIPIECDRISK
jgi:hypothetical protein